MKWVLCAVAAAALLLLGWRAAAIGLAGDDLDPVGHIGAQDESLYAHSAIAMANGAGWFTPMFMGRYGLYKPPLLMWAAGASVKALGISTFALRLPVVAASAAAVCLIFLWVLELRSWPAATAAAGLVLGSHLFLALGAMCLTDGLLAAGIVVAGYTLLRDPRLESRRGLWAFSLAVAGGILAKSVAGLLPVAILGLYRVIAPVKCRPAIGRMLLAASIIGAMAAPWFLYQMAAHPRWFWAEHVGLELVAFGTRTPPQTSREGQAAFYAVRQWLTDPAMVLLALSALPAWFAALRRRSPPALLLLAWTAVVAGSALVWSYRNLSYLLPLVPALAVVSAGYGPFFRAKRATWGLVVVLAVFGVKAASPLQPWGLSFQPGTKLELAPVLSAYCEMGRANELIEVGMDDALYAASLPLERVRYLLIGAKPPAGGYSLDFGGMGIVLNARDFTDLGGTKARSLPRLREWGLDSTEAVGTVVFAGSREELVAIMRAHPRSDLLAPAEYRERLEAELGRTHEAVAASGRWVLLLSRSGKTRLGPVRGCRL